MGITKSFKGLFWSAPGGAATQRTGAAPDDVSDAAIEALAAEAAAKPTSTPASVGPAPAGSPDPAAAGSGDRLPDIDFTAIYTRTNTLGDPRVDQVLTAFEAMKAAMPAPQLAVAIGATAKAIGADPSAIVQTLTQRLSALDTTMTDEQRSATEREAARDAELATTTQKVHMEIDAMEHKCAAFRQQLAAATERVHHKTAAERGVIAAFGAKARGEADRLKALRDFLAPPGGAASPAAAKPAKA
jgi:hypothetical protein